MRPARRLVPVAVEAAQLGAAPLRPALEPGQAQAKDPAPDGDDVHVREGGQLGHEVGNATWKPPSAAITTVMPMVVAIRLRPAMGWRRRMQFWAVADSDAPRVILASMHGQEPQVRYPATSSHRKRPITHVSAPTSARPPTKFVKNRRAPSDTAGPGPGVDEAGSRR